LVYPQLAALLVNQHLTPELANHIAFEAAQNTQPGNDMHASADYRKHLAQALMTRALWGAYRQAQGQTQGITAH
jgi:carbon-monoxide dehydrogenase medium subunit/2-furoyl-CoA dehydrogenase FAD binding subunit